MTFLKFSGNIDKYNIFDIQILAQVYTKKIRYIKMCGTTKITTLDLIPIFHKEILAPDPFCFV